MSNGEDIGVGVAVEETPVLSEAESLQTQIEALMVSLQEAEDRIARLELDAELRQEDDAPTAGLDAMQTEDDCINNFPWELQSFYYVLSGSTCTIKAGTLRIHGKGKWEASDTDLSFSGADEWAYLEFTKGGSSATIKHAATEPESVTPYYRIPLYHFEKQNGIYVLIRDCRLDINLGAPM